MHREIQVEIAVLGGGCAGLWLAHDFAKRGFTCALVEHGSLGGYASQGNQSWLHSGALYAVLESEQASDSSLAQGLRSTARECFKGYSRLRRFARRHCKHAIDSRSGCMFLYADQAKAERAHSTLTNYGLEPRVYTSRLEVLEPILTGTEANVALVTRDLPFDAARILAAVSRRAAALGTRFVNASKTLDHLEIVREGPHWVARDDSFAIHASVIIFATGALVLKQQDSWHFLAAPKPTIQKCAVAAFNSRLCTRLLAFRIREAQGLNMVPFRSGTTMNLGDRDVETSDVLDRRVPDTFFDGLSDVLSLYAPGISRWRVPVRAHAYICQKVGNELSSSRPSIRYGKRHFFWSESQPGLYYAYPGKFTLSANCSSALVRHIQNSGVLTKRTSRTQIVPGRIPSICGSPYHIDPTHRLVASKGGEVRFVSRYA